MEGALKRGTSTCELNLLCGVAKCFTGGVKCFD